jgi:hypothetical protein
MRGYAKSTTLHTSAYVSIRQHASAYVTHVVTHVGGTRSGPPWRRGCGRVRRCCSTDTCAQSASASASPSPYVSIRQNMPAYAYVSIPQHMSAYAYVSIRQHTSAHVSIRLGRLRHHITHTHTHEYIKYMCIHIHIYTYSIVLWKRSGSRQYLGEWRKCMPSVQNR